MPPTQAHALHKPLGVKHSNVNKAHKNLGGQKTMDGIPAKAWRAGLLSPKDNENSWQDEILYTIQNSGFPTSALFGGRERFLEAGGKNVKTANVDHQQDEGDKAWASSWDDFGPFQNVKPPSHRGPNPAQPPSPAAAQGFLACCGSQSGATSSPPPLNARTIEERREEKERQRRADPMATPEHWRVRRAPRTAARSPKTLSLLNLPAALSLPPSSRPAHNPRRQG
eukprot:CAMPEP_0114146636 /NCGR_PEP_ID=MMETSP0043_2-20121206/20672_1 /TAXON_ID=464988 /ORGANISM="Hemiselmis andersenii, Strain CCMP644" /LENGTH=224 /DNA_ID=CAMNT_0001241107 /DNA_START=293 /DNA_END=963 /DNA_ORIENTATION=+